MSDSLRRKSSKTRISGMSQGKSWAKFAGRWGKVTCITSYFRKTHPSITIDHIHIQKKIEKDIVSGFRKSCEKLGVDPRTRWSQKQLDRMISAFSTAFNVEKKTKVGMLEDGNGLKVPIYKVWFEGITYPGCEIADDAHEAKSIKSFRWAWRLYFMDLFTIGANGDKFFHDEKGDTGKGFTTIRAIQFSTPEEFIMKYGLYGSISS